jgi:hypothetical protein
MLAHVLSGGGPLNVVLLLVGACLVVAGIRLRDRKPDAATWGSALTWVGIGLFVVGLVIDASPGTTSSNATVRILEPADGAQIAAGRPVQVAVDVENGTIALSPSDPDGGHLHLSVDGKLRRMPYSTEAELTLAPGRHEIRVEYVDARHLSFSPEIATTIEVTAT